MLIDFSLDINTFSQQVQWQKSCCRYLYKKDINSNQIQGFIPHQFREDICIKQEINQTIRKSEVTHIQINNPQTNQKEKWRMIKYTNGHFTLHVDNQIHPHQIGNLILLPPKTQCNYQGGALVLIQNQQRVKYLPHQTKWTKIFIPLGTIHCVQPVIGTRISLIKQLLTDKQYHYQFPQFKNQI